jgi:hypothetical protein
MIFKVKEEDDQQLLHDLLLLEHPSPSPAADHDNVVDDY